MKEEGVYSISVIDQGLNSENCISNIIIDNYKQNISNDKYLLLIINDEKQREKLSKLLGEEFPNYEHDIINVQSDVGSNIKKDVELNYKSFNEFPLLIYYENGKAIYSETVIDSMSFKLYKSDLEEVLNN